MKNVKKIQKQLFVNYLKMATHLIIMFLMVFLISCDTLKEDSIIEAKLINERVDITALSKNVTIIDLKTAMVINGAVTINVTTKPKLGSIENLGNDLLKYTPSIDIESGADNLVFSVSGKDQNFLFSDTVNIQIISQVADSCFFYAIMDKYTVPTDTVTFLNVLNNDFICDSSAVVSISNPPVSGTAQVVGRVIEYTSGLFENTDSLIYKVTSANDPTKITYASVVINVGNCIVELGNDDFYYDLGIVELKFLVLDNDELCNKEITASIATQPKYGIASFDNNNFLSYLPNRDSTYRDSLMYKVCYSGGCRQAKVTFDIVGTGCQTLTALDDTYDLADTTLTSAIFFDVLANDTFCNEVLLNLISQPTKGVASIQNNQIRYEADSSVVQNDSFQYKICDLNDSSNCDQAIVNILWN
jgi:hypothetical protein